MDRARQRQRGKGGRGFYWNWAEFMVIFSSWSRVLLFVCDLASLVDPVTVCRSRFPLLRFISNGAQ